jgi:hypothetical protein
VQVTGQDGATAAAPPSSAVATSEVLITTPRPQRSDSGPAMSRPMPTNRVAAETDQVAWEAGIAKARASVAMSDWVL